MNAVVQSASEASQAASQIAHAASQVASAATQLASDGWFGIPWVIWSGLVGAGIASVASWLVAKLTAANSLVLLQRQHVHDGEEAEEQRKHDAKQKDEDRKGAIRREVYTEAVEQAHALLAALGSLTQRGLDTSNDADALQAFLKSNAKIWLVAEAEAAHLSRDLASEFSELFLHSLVASMPARQAMEPVRVRARQLEQAEIEFARLCIQFNDAKAKPDSHEEQTRISVLLKDSGAFRADLREAQDDARTAAAPFIFDAFRATFGEVRAVQRTLCAMVSALRAELNLPRDDEEFLVQLRDMERRAWAAMNQAAGKNPPVPMPEIAE